MSITKRIDELGRIIIPKDIRKSLRIDKGNELEITIDGNKIILSKDEAISKITDISKKICDSFYDIMKNHMVIYDMNCIIASSNQKLINEEISETLKKNIDNSLKIKHGLIISENYNIDKQYIICPIINYTNIIGGVLIYSNYIDEKNIILCKFVSKFLSNYINF